MENAAKKRTRKPSQILWWVTIVVASISVLSFFLSDIPTLSRWGWLGPLSEIGGACDAITFLALCTGSLQTIGPSYLSRQKIRLRGTRYASRRLTRKLQDSAKCTRNSI